MHGEEVRGPAGLGIGWRRWLLLTLMAGFALVVITRFASFRALVQVLSQARWPWVVVAILLHVLFFVVDAQLHQFCFSAVEVQSRVTHLIPVLVSALFINAVIPTGGTGGAMIFVDDAVRRGESGVRTAVGTVLALLSDLSTLIPFLIFSMVFLQRHDQLRSYHIIGGLFLTIFIIGLTGALILAHLQPTWLRRLLGYVQRAANAAGSLVKRPSLVSDEWVNRNTAELAEGSGVIARHPGYLALALLWALVLHIVNLVGLYALFLAFEQPVQLGTLVAGFSLGIVFWVVTIIPQGVGAVEGIMALVFTGLGIPAEKTAAIVLAFRGVNFWLPIAAGLVFIYRVPTVRAAIGQSPRSMNISAEHSGKDRER